MVQDDADRSFSLTMPLSTSLARSTITMPPTSTPTPRKRRRSDEDPGQFSQDTTASQTEKNKMLQSLVSYIADVCCFTFNQMWLIFIEHVAGLFSNQCAQANANEAETRRLA